MTDSTKPYNLEDLLYLMERLRHPEFGCPWDLKQSYKTIAPSTIEEAYEVVDAIEREDYGHLKEELGDLVFQAVFYSQLAREEGRFDFADIVHSLVAKLIRRHPHVFPEGNLRSSDLHSKVTEAGVKQNWEAIKQQEREAKGGRSLMADLPASLPAMTRALKLQKRAAQVGFDWPDTAGVLEKLQEEVRELEDAVTRGEPAATAAEAGDLLFTCVNLCRHLGVEPETALRATNNKFIRRFESMERQAVESGAELRSLSQVELDNLWTRAKKEV